jgi:hypothetical protein
MSSSYERAWFLSQPEEGHLAIRLESGVTRLLPAAACTRSGLLSGMLDQNVLCELRVPVGFVDAWWSLLSWDDVSRRSMSSALLLLCTRVRDLHFCILALPVSESGSLVASFVHSLRETVSSVSQHSMIAKRL